MSVRTEPDAAAPRAAGRPADQAASATASGCHRNPLAALAFLRGALDEALAGVMRAPPWAYAGLTGIALAAAVLLALR